jgi:hypothetical protein
VGTHTTTKIVREPSFFSKDTKLKTEVAQGRKKNFVMQMVER